MGLLQNFTLHAQYPYKRTGATATAAETGCMRSQLGVRGASQLTPFVSWAGWPNTASFPPGYQFGNGWLPAMKADGVWKANLGKLSLYGVGAFTRTHGANGLRARSAITGVGSFAKASCGLIVSAIATLSGSGDLTANVRGRLDAAASLYGSGDMTGAIGAIAGMSAVIAGVGTLTGAPTAEGSMSATIKVTGDILTTANVAAAVWSALAASNNDPGTMGNKLNSASAAGDPWTAELPGTYADGQAGNIVGNALSAEESGFITLVLKILRNKQITDPVTGKFTVYDDNGIDVLYQGNLFEDAAGVQPYRGQGAERREKLA